MDELDSALRCELLTALLKLFFKERALECRPALEKLMKAMLNDVSDVDAHDRAMFYIRLLKQDLFKAGEVLASSAVEARNFSRMEAGEETKPTEFFEELNTLAVVYGKHATQFVDEVHLFPPRTEIPVFDTTSPAMAYPSSPSIGQVLSTPSPMDFVPRQQQQQQGPTYVPQFELDQARFQSLWMVEAPDVKAVLEEEKALPMSTGDIELRLAAHGVNCMASGNLGNDSFKFYFYALTTAPTQQPVLAEVFIQEGRSVTVTVKTPGTVQQAEQFARSIYEWL